MQFTLTSVKHSLVRFSYVLQVSRSLYKCMGILHVINPFATVVFNILGAFYGKFAKSGHLNRY